MTENILLKDLYNIFPKIDIILPTVGRFYPIGVLNETADPRRISVGTLGIMDEFTYKDPFLLVSGKAIDQLITNLCGDQILVPDELCEIDVETILVAARLASYGPDMKVKHICDKKKEIFTESEPDKVEETICGHESEVYIDLHDFILQYTEIQDLDMFILTLPKVEQTVYFKPTPYHTTIEIMRNVMGNHRKMEEFKETGDEFILNTDQYVKYEELMGLSADLQVKAVLDCIWAVELKDGRRVEDPHILAAWIYALPDTYFNILSKRINEITQYLRRASLKKYICEVCGGENEFNLNMNPEILFLADSEVSNPSKISSNLSEENKKPSRKPLRISQRLR